MEPEKFVISGRHAGSAFGIVGEGFGGSGSLTIGGRPIATTLWTDKDIRGILPIDLKPGEVIVTGSTGVVQKGVWPRPHPQVILVATPEQIALAERIVAAPATAPATPLVVPATGVPVAAPVTASPVK